LEDHPLHLIVTELHAVKRDTHNCLLGVLLGPHHAALWLAKALDNVFRALLLAALHFDELLGKRLHEIGKRTLFIVAVVQELFQGEFLTVRSDPA
jgi:hypothetical protein